MTTISKFQDYNNFIVDDFSLEDYLHLFEYKKGEKHKVKAKEAKAELSIWKTTQDKVVKGFKLTFFFLSTFGTSIKAFYPVVESLITNMNLTDVEINKETVVLLTICALAIIFEQEKHTYKAMFEELRLRGVYDSLKKLVSSMDVFKNIFKFIAKNTGRVIGTFMEMFGYTALLIPFLSAIHAISIHNGVNLDSLSEIFTKVNILSFVIGMGTYTLKEFIMELISKIKNFNFRNIPFFKKAIDAVGFIDTDTIEEIEAEVESEMTDQDIKKYSEFDDKELIQDDVNESLNDDNLAMSRIKEKYSTDEVTTMIDEEIFGGNWIDADWEDDFEDEYDAYLETGNGEAEAAVVVEIINWYKTQYQVDLEFDDTISLTDNIKEEYGIWA